MGEPTSKPTDVSSPSPMDKSTSEPAIYLTIVLGLCVGPDKNREEYKVTATSLGVNYKKTYISNVNKSGGCFLKGDAIIWNKESKRRTGCNHAEQCVCKGHKPSSTDKLTHNPITVRTT